MRRDLKDHPLAKLIREARAVKISDAEKEAQSASWQRGELAMGNDAQEATERQALRDRVREQDLQMALLSAEFGFRCREKGYNLEMTLSKVRENFKEKP